MAVLCHEFKSKAYIGSLLNAWLTTKLTNEWVNNVLGSFGFGRRQLGWNFYECHMQESVVQSLNAKVYAVILHGECRKYTQAPDILGNDWMGQVKIHSETTAGNLKLPPRRTVTIQWLLESWREISTELIKKIISLL